MAACVRSAVKVLAGSHGRLLVTSGHSLTSVPQVVPRNLPVRTFSARRAEKKEKEKVPRFLQRAKNEKEEKVEKVQRTIDNTNRHKPYGFTAWEPVDDVYVVKHYPRPVYDVGVAVDMLKMFQQLDYTHPEQNVYLDMKLDMKLEKKKKVEVFVSTVQLPFQINKEDNKVLVFTENSTQAEVARANGAAFVGGTELIEEILEEKIQADFYLAVPEITAQLLPLKSKLRKKFPKSKRGWTIGTDIARMLETFKKGHEYQVEDECYIRTIVAVLDMPKEQILANIETIIKDVCSYKPASFGPFIERALIVSSTSEALHFDSGPFVPKAKEEDVEQARA
ncbi:39S ribosomal protein L1, mitochondrial [Arapaima gigas]